MVIRTISPLQKKIFPNTHVLNGDKLMLYNLIFCDNSLILRPCYTSKPTEPVIPFGLKLKDNTLMTLIISTMYYALYPIQNRETNLATHVGQMSTHKDEFSSIIAKSTDVRTSQSKTGRVFYDTYNI